MRTKKLHKVIHGTMDAEEIQEYEKMVAGARQMTIKEYIALMATRKTPKEGSRKGKQNTAHPQKDADTRTGMGKHKQRC